ncbi:PepSY-associated TM helix domain-containing protein [Ottowia thiooxydans]|uniref:PepSY-associated TM helix domain-containing protein n=1 Tax=Ottowia thiooxydans TaxID=219182 RepID=UPI00040A6C02|nr:PepSY-associated TM helix domain-containing protein [Ottowia thiooxydans]
MKEGFRQCAAWLHTWSGLVVGWVLFFVFVTGTAGYFQNEITRWMQPERPLVPRLAQPAPVEPMLRAALERLERMAPAAASWRVTLPHESLNPRGWQELAIQWEEMPEPGHQFGTSAVEKLDSITGAVLPPEAEPRATAGGTGLYRLHYELHYMPYEWAIRIVGVCTMLMLIAIVTGIITHKKIFKEFFTFRPGKGQRSWLDAHNAISVMALPFFLMITYSGLIFFMYSYMPAGRDVIYGSGVAARNEFFDELQEREKHKHLPIGRPVASLTPLLAQAEADWGSGQLASMTIERHEGGPPQIVLSRAHGGSLDFWNPPTLRFNAITGQALPDEPSIGGSSVLTQSVTLNLHVGRFAGIWGRWLYFVASLLGCAMIGTGLVLWTVKRRRHHLSSGRESVDQFGVRLVENLNVASIAGLPLAVAAYFCANRLLPVDLADRAAWEFHSLFTVWLGTLFYALARPLRRAWIELLWGCCLAYALVPFINALTTHRHLGRSLPARDWEFAGFDLTMLALASLFAVMAIKVRRRLMPKQPALTAEPTALTPAKGLA